MLGTTSRSLPAVSAADTPLTHSARDTHGPGRSAESPDTRIGAGVPRLVGFDDGAREMKSHLGSRRHRSVTIPVAWLPWCKKIQREPRLQAAGCITS